MSHEITKTDNVVLHRQSAWHGMGVVVEDAPTPREALTLAGLDWGVTQRTLFTETIDGDGQTQRVPVVTHVANYRDDVDELLGIVTAGYHPVSNADLADFCSALHETMGTIRVESAGSIKGGKRVWFLLKGEPFDVANGDDIFPYLLLSNGHDGGASLRGTPTTVRVVCSNTLHCVIPRMETKELGKAAFAFRHTGSIMKRLEQAREAIATYNRGVNDTRIVANALAAKDVKQEDVQRFFLESYTEDFGDIPKNPQDVKEQRRRDKAISAYRSFSRRFDDERDIAGASVWNAMNAYTGLVQHDMKARGQDDVDRVEKRVVSNLFGLGAERTNNALRRAYEFAATL